MTPQHPTSRRRFLRVALPLLLAGLSACAPVHPVESATMTHNPLLTNLRPWCMGRLVFDRPTASTLEYEKYRYAGNDIKVTPNVTQGTFKYTVEKREAELRTKKRYTLLPLKEQLKRGLKNGIVDTETPRLEQAASPSPNSRMFIFKDSVDFADGAFDGEGYILAGSSLLTMNYLLGSTGVQIAIRNNSTWYPETTYLEDWAVPTERGFCIKGALIGGPSRNSESINQTFWLMPNRVATFVVKMRDGIEQDQKASLLDALPDLQQRLGLRGLLGGAHILRKGTRQFAGMPAEEVLISASENGVQLFRFYLLARGNPDSTAQPYTTLQLLLGDAPEYGLPPERATSPLDETQALQAWDALVNSFRLRPGAM